MMVDVPDAEAIELLNEYGPIVRRIARSACYSSATIDFADLCQVGDVAVLRAIKSYNPTYGTTIKSYVARIVRQDIYNEAARFLGVFTVDHRVTSLAAKVSKLHAKGKTDEQIAETLTTSNRKFDAEHVRDLRITYSRRQHSDLQPDDAADEGIAEESTIQEILRGVVQNDTDVAILEQRLMGDASVKEVAADLKLSQRRVYELENDLKDRIRKAIEGVTE
ncbi:MAG: sigma-70 family RNA polymerase sigma factor [Hydrogenophaga sp.]|uniref:sigma-70 family RNA polymerase sigma factor n=1 Tax=Hydrogenophaga sp. TaxID=1904254 RepID=UPI0026324334|nr:sigma-70 family RNA polymerase sigma factor [Hydrogenophaga sp.]MCV0439764.1 sigma-70 family RNA polymerase sigma factor [Hydrogenophaga sp.]